MRLVQVCCWIKIQADTMTKYLTVVAMTEMSAQMPKQKSFQTHLTKSHSLCLFSQHKTLKESGKERIPGSTGPRPICRSRYRWKVKVHKTNQQKRVQGFPRNIAEFPQDSVRLVEPVNKYSSIVNDDDCTIVASVHSLPTHLEISTFQSQVFPHTGVKSRSLQMKRMLPAINVATVKKKQQQ